MAKSGITVVGLPELNKALKKAGTGGVDVLKQQLQASGLELETEAKKNLSSSDAVDTGQARAETRYRSTDHGLGAEVYSPNPKAAAIEFGTAPASPGGLKRHFPPPQALEAWARRHGFPPGSGFLIARAIYMRGIPARPFLSKAHDTIAPRFVQRLTDALNRFLEGL